MHSAFRARKIFTQRDFFLKKIVWEITFLGMYLCSCDHNGVVRLRMKKKRALKILVTAGPTRAYLDRVRYLSNFSTGKLGFLLCQTLLKNKFSVSAVVGPTACPFADLKLHTLIPVETTREMHAAVMNACRKEKPDVVVFTAAVLDFEPTRLEKGKVSSNKKKWTLSLRPTPKIIDDVGKKFPKVRRVGFKLEWGRVKSMAAAQQAIEVLEKKKLDALVLNFLSEIEGKNHPAVFVTRSGSIIEVDTKDEIASAIAQFIATL